MLTKKLKFLRLFGGIYCILCNYILSGINTSFFLSLPNKAESSWTLHHHEPIVSREQFDLAQRILNGRAESLQGKDKHSNRYCFSGKIKCGKCGRSFVARYKKRKDGTQYKTWRCFEASRNGSPKEDAQGNAIGCSNDSIRNEDALHIMYLATRQLELDFVGIVANLQAAIEEVLRQDIGWFDYDGMQERIADTEKKKSRLIELYTENLINMEEFVAERKKCDDEICKLRQMMESAEAQQEVNEKKNAILKEIGDTIREIVNGLHYDDEFYREILDRMVVHDREHIDVYLKCLPQKLSFLGKSAALLTEKSGKNGEETAFLPTCDASVPTSVSAASSSSAAACADFTRFSARLAAAVLILAGELLPVCGLPPILALPPPSAIMALTKASPL